MARRAAGLTITAEDKTAYVGAQQPELTYKVDGLLEAGKEMLSDVTLRVSAPEGVVPMNRAGTYDIVVASATYDTGKYELTTENGTLTVRARHSSRDDHRLNRRRERRPSGKRHGHGLPC